MLLAIALAPGRQLEAAVYHVGNIADLTARIGNAVAGDQIILSNGVYTTTGTINITKSGTAIQPILIAAETIGGAEITGTSGFNLNGGSYVIIQGFHFTHTNSNLNISSTSSHCRITRNIFDLDPVQFWVYVQGNDTEVDHNLFRNKVALGVYVVIRGPGQAIAQRLWLHHNDFYNHHFPGSNGGESTQLGLANFQLMSAWAVVENNLYEKANGDPEAISVKTSDDVIRYNTLTNSSGSFVLRSGNRERVEDNFILNSGGIRFYGDDNLIFNNYLQGLTNGIEFGSGEVPEISDSFNTLHGAAHRARVVFNTLVNGSLYFSESTYPDPPSDCVVANNILQGNSGTFVNMAVGMGNFVWQTNIFWGSASYMGSPTGGYQQYDPLLVTTNGIPYHIASNSPVIDASFAAPGEVVADMDGQPRGGIPDIGADEFSDASVARRPLNTNDVGPYVAATNFDIVAMPWIQTVIPGRGTSYTNLLSAYNGFTNTVTLSVSNVPVGASASFSSASITNGYGASTLSVTTANTMSPGRYTLLITASSLDFTNTTTACLTVGNLPANWSDVDINNPGIVGSADFYMNTFAVKGGGADIFGASDQFNFAYQPCTNGLMLTARVATQPNTSTSAKSGVMIRETTNANARYVDVVVSLNTIKMEARTSTGGSAVTMAAFSGASSPVGTNTPLWVRLVFSGNTFTGYGSSNGVNWVLMGVTNVTLASSLAGLAVTAHDNTQLNTTTFDNVSAQSSPIINTQPASLVVYASSNAIFTVDAGGPGPLDYQWWFNATNSLVNETNASLAIINASSTNAGNYTVVVTNSFGSVTSAVAILTVNLSILHMAAFTNAGPATWICPAGVSLVQVECWGGGGAGGSALRSPNSNSVPYGGGGAGGAYARLASYPVIAGNTYYVNVGAGGVAATGTLTNGIKLPGGDSWFNSVNSEPVGAGNCVAKGGDGGECAVGNTAPSVYGAGGVGTTDGSIGDVLFAGGSGGAVTSSTGYGGSGGGSGGTGSNGNPGGTNGTATAAVPGGGPGGSPNATAGSSGPGQAPASAPGGGGGGCRATLQQPGGNGAAGQVVLTYNYDSPIRPVISNLNMSANGSSFTLTGTGATNQAYVLQRTSSLAPPVAWTSVVTNSSGSNGLFILTDPQTANLAQQFYRVTTP